MVIVATKATEISLDRPIVEPDGGLTVQSRAFFGTIMARSLIIGTGSPEGSDGTGNDSNGWILV